MCSFQWTTWTPCLGSCVSGTGIRQRTLSCQCIDSTTFAILPPTDPRVIAACNYTNQTETCAVTSCCTFGAFGSWSGCSLSCGGGTQSRLQQCFCGGVLSPDSYCLSAGLIQNGETASCNTQPCCQYNPWSTWGTCFGNCGAGTQLRSRTCSCYGAPADISNCIVFNSTYVEAQTCILPNNCCSWTSWGPWGACTANCGGGVQYRIPYCSCNGVITTNLTMCFAIGAPIIDSQACNTQPCCTYGPWGSWGPCSSTCGWGVQARDATCVCGPVVSAPSNCAYLGPPPSTVQACNTQSCCSWGSWLSWGPCSTTCGSGIQVRSGIQCNCNGALVDISNCLSSGLTLPTVPSQSCVNPPCCPWGAWSSWGVCNATCGVGYQTRSATCTCTRIQDCLLNSPQPLELQQCQGLPACCSWSGWGSWSPCSNNCGSGYSTRLGVCSCGGSVAPLSNCTGVSGTFPYEVRTCTTTCCSWAGWTAFSPCTAPCNGGTHNRTGRCFCNGIENAPATCLGLLGGVVPVDTQTCNQQPCCSWGSWNDWSVCTADCDGGSQYRQQPCFCNGVPTSNIAFCQPILTGQAPTQIQVSNPIYSNVFAVM